MKGTNVFLLDKGQTVSNVARASMWTENEAAKLEKGDRKKARQPHFIHTGKRSCWTHPEKKIKGGAGKNRKKGGIHDEGKKRGGTMRKLNTQGGRLLSAKPASGVIPRWANNTWSDHR